MTVEWTNPSVIRFLEEANAKDPYTVIEDRARTLALTAMENGWKGPPYDPFVLAELEGIETVARQDVDDARLVTAASGKPRIEFNPNRRPARVRFSVAHEMGHLFFADWAEQVRYRDRDAEDPVVADYWQLEVLCNVAAAELLMPVGAFPLEGASDLALPQLLDFRARFGVSTEALLRRVVKLTSESVCLFAGARLPDGGGFRIDYTVGSRAWSGRVEPGSQIPPSSVLRHCTAVGFSAEAEETWAGQELRIQAVGIPPYPGDRFPRVAGLLIPEASASPVEGIRYLRGDASRPQVDGPTIIAHVVNNEAVRWGGRGFITALAEQFPESPGDYAEWSKGSGNRRLGAVHVGEAGDNMWIASLVAQAGYGAGAASPRLRLGALRSALQAVRKEALDREASVHMPPIGTGQGGAAWPPIRDLLLEELVDRGVPVTVYVLEDNPMPEDAVAGEQLALA